MTAPAPADSGPLADARARAQAAAERFGGAEAEEGALHDEIATIEVQLTSVRREYDALGDTVGQAALDSYINSGSELGVLGDEDINRYTRVEALSRLATRKSRDQADKLRVVRQDLALRELALSDRLRRQQRVAATLDRERVSLFDELQKLEVLEAEQAARAALARTGLLSSGDRSPRVLSRGGWACPVAGATAFSDTWGEPRSDGRRHKGVDMFSDYGTPLVAVVGGTVEDNTGGAGGIAVFLYGDDGITYYYAHMQSIRRTGRVSSGEVVGEVGDSGNAIGTPHLHFEVQPGGSAVNPYPWVAGHC